MERDGCRRRHHHRLWHLGGLAIVFSAGANVLGAWLGAGIDSLSTAAKFFAADDAHARRGDDRQKSHLAYHS